MASINRSTVARVDFSSLENIRKVKGLSKTEFTKQLSIGVTTYWTWRSRNSAPLWAIKRARHVRRAAAAHVDIEYENIRGWKHKLLARGKSYHMYPSQKEIKKARKAAFMFARRHDYRISTRLVRGQKSMYLVITRVSDFLPGL